MQHGLHGCEHKTSRENTDYVIVSFFSIFYRRENEKSVKWVSLLSKEKTLS